MNLEIRDSIFRDVKALSQTMRPKDRLESERLGFDAHTALTYSFKNAVYRKTALIDSQVTAMWGIVGSLTSDTGRPYFVTGAKFLSISPIMFIRLYKKELENFLKVFSNLEGLVDLQYGEAVRSLKLAGAVINKPISINDNLFYRYTVSV